MNKLFAAAIALAAMASPAMADTGHFTSGVTDTVTQISSGCMRGGYTVTDSGSNYVVCSHPIKNFMMDLLVGGPYTYSTTDNVRFQVVSDGNNSEVQYTSWVESTTVDGVRRMPTNGHKSSRNLNKFLQSLGATISP